ncbi:MAG: DNA methyltransferase [Polaribacter sp.]
MSYLKKFTELKKNKLNTTYLTHNFHPYPAKFIPQIPRFFIEEFTNENETVLDPFVGCGTTIVESKLLNRNSIGVDLNHIATLISETKSTSLNADEIEEILHFIENLERTSSIITETIDFPNIDHWFQQNVKEELMMLTSSINKVNNSKISNFLKTGLSSIITSVSNQESDTRYVAKNKDIPDGKTLALFKVKIKSMVERIKEFSETASDSISKIYNADSTNLHFIKDNSVDLVVTSPPYANTYDYYLYHKLRMYWLEFDVANVKKNEIGSRDKHSSQRKEIDDFNENIKKCFQEAVRVLKPNRHAIVIIGDSVIRKKLYDAKKMMISMGKEIGLEFIDSTSENLKKTTRMFNPNFTNALKFEHVMVFKNVKNDL